jgi:hypothetical protein
LAVAYILEDSTAQASGSVSRLTSQWTRGGNSYVVITLSLNH